MSRPRKLMSIREFFTGIPREAVRLCGIRQKPVESWIKDAEGRNVPELGLNSVLMMEAFLQLIATGLGALILVSAATVVAWTNIKKMDFWFITVIGIIQTAKVVSFISGPTVRFLVQFPAVSIHHILISRRTRRGHDVGDVTEFVGLASLVPIVLAAAPMVIATSCYELSYFGLHGVHNYGDSDIDTRRGNIKPALIAFYSLVLAQGTVILSWWSVSLARLSATQRVRGDYFGIGNTDGIELMDRYITDTQDKCMEKGVFSTNNRTLVSFAAELLQSEHRSDHVSAVSVLRVLTIRKERAAGAVEQICSSEQVVGSLFKLLRFQSHLDLETKAETAEILTKLACNLRLTDVPGAAHSISSLLDPRPRLMKTAAKAGLPGADEAGGGPSPPPEEIEKHQPLFVYGLMILDSLASDPGNCTEICKTTDLVPKILAPLTHGLLNTLRNEPKTIQIVKASLRVVAKLTSKACESSSKLRRELVSENGKTARNIIWIMRNSGDEQEMRMLAVKVLTRLTLGQPMMHSFFDPQDSSPAGKSQNALAVDLRSWEVICQEVGDQFPALVSRMNADRTSTEHRAVTAGFLARICAKSKTDQDTMYLLRSVSNSLSKVLNAIVITNIKDMAKRRFLASFLGLAVQILENELVTAPAFADAVRGLSTGKFCRFSAKLKAIIMEMTKEKESENETCLVITKAAAKLVTWTISIGPDYAQKFQGDIVGKLQDIEKAMGDLERCVVLCGYADEMKPYETLQTLVQKVRNLIHPLPPQQHDPNV